MTKKNHLILPEIWWSAVKVWWCLGDQGKTSQKITKSLNANHKKIRERSGLVVMSVRTLNTEHSNE